MQIAEKIWHDTPCQEPAKIPPRTCRDHAKNQADKRRQQNSAQISPSPKRRTTPQTPNCKIGGRRLPRRMAPSDIILMSTNDRTDGHDDERQTADGRRAAVHFGSFRFILVHLKFILVHFNLKYLKLSLEKFTLKLLKRKKRY